MRSRIAGGGFFIGEI